MGDVFEELSFFILALNSAILNLCTSFKKMFLISRLRSDDLTLHGQL